MQLLNNGNFLHDKPNHTNRNKKYDDNCKNHNHLIFRNIGFFCIHDDWHSIDFAKWMNIEIRDCLFRLF
jgi:hypothetical protein